jgi:hypothetical protein
LIQTKILKFNFSNIATEVESRTRLVRMIHFARARNLVKGHVWRESPVTASNPKRLHFRFELNRDNFALLQKRLADKQQEDASSS